MDDDLVIADMTELNPNVFYEIGIRHMKQLPIVHIVKKGGAIPFDVKLFRAIPYDYADPAELRTARSDLRRALDAVLALDYVADNPVIRARGVVKLVESAAPESAILQQQLTEIFKRLSAIENSSISSKRAQYSDEANLENFLARYPVDGSALVARVSRNYSEETVKAIADSIRKTLDSISGGAVSYTFGSIILVKFKLSFEEFELASMVDLIESQAGVASVSVVSPKRK